MKSLRAPIPSAVGLFFILCVSAPGALSAQTISLEMRARLTFREPGTPTSAERSMPLTEERVRAVIDGQHATTDIRQSFHNRTGTRAEGRYVLRPSRAARVEGFAYYIGEERIVGEVLERQAAREVYRRVTTQRRDPAILEQTSEGEFTFRVFPIEPNENKRVEIQYSEWLRQRRQQIEYRAPINSPNARIEVIVQDPRATDLRSPSHAIRIERLSNGAQRVTAERANGRRSEFVLRYRAQQADWSLSSYVHRDPNQAAYVVVSLAAPRARLDQIADKDVTLVFDHSGSMSGAKIANARLAAADIVRRLGANDRVNIIAFDDDVDPLFVRPEPANAQNRARAQTFISSLRAGGGTDLAFALSRAFQSQRVDSGDRPQVIVFLTDGQSEVAPVLTLAQGSQVDARVFSVGVGSDVNRALLSRLAALKRGRFTFIERADRIEAEVGHLYSQISRPLLTNVRLEVDGGVVSRIYPRTLPDLFYDDEWTVAARIRGDGPVRLTLHGRLNGAPVAMNAVAQLRGNPQRPWVGRHWAQARVDDLMDEIALAGERPELRNEVVSLALAYNFVTPYTAFLAIPEREVTAEAARTLQQARRQRADAQARFHDAPGATFGGRSRRGIATHNPPTAGGDATLPAPAGEPMFEHRVGTPGVEMEASGGAREEMDEADYSAGDGEDLAITESSVMRGAGCASCSTMGAGPAAPTLLWIAILGLGFTLIRRRR